MTCSVYIDESGEAGISRIRTGSAPGASPYFVLAAAVMPNAVRINARSVLSRVEARITRKWDHATDLTHSQTVFWARSASQVNLRFFAVISNKATLGTYSDRIARDPDKFYNKCAVYLLERVGKYLIEKGEDRETPEVYFEERNHDYDAMRRYIGKIKDNPMHSDAKYLRLFNPFAISSRTKKQEDLLKYADLASYAVYQCANKSNSNFEIPEPRYLEELSSRFGVDKSGKVIGAGIKCIHSLSSLSLDHDISRRLAQLRGLPMHHHRG